MNGDYAYVYEKMKGGKILLWWKDKIWRRIFKLLEKLERKKYDYNGE